MKARGARAAGLLVLAGCAATGDPLPAWNEGPAKAAIVDFVERTTDRGGSDWVEPAARVAVFDNDGTLWAEQPAYFQLLFAVDRVRALAPEHPEWAGRAPFQAALDGDLAALAAGGEEGLLELLLATHAGTTADEFAAAARAWLAEARHPATGRPFTRMTYAPMLELLGYLRANDFDVWIVSGGGADFLRVFASEVYGVPPDRVVGSRIATAWEEGDAGPALVRRPAIGFVNDGPGKPVGIHEHAGRRPIAAFGNSDGDLEMLRWTDAGAGPRLCLLVRHTDAEREWAYDRESHVGRLDAALDEAAVRGWTVVDMARDWRRVYPD